MYIWDGLRYFMKPPDVASIVISQEEEVVSAEYDQSLQGELPNSVYCRANVKEAGQAIRHN